MSGTSTKFVNIHNPADIKNASIQLSVRSHVARYQWQKHRKEARRKGTEQNFLPVRVELVVPASHENTGGNKIPRLVGGYRVDPFYSFPVWRPLFSLLIDHCTYGAEFIYEIVGSIIAAAKHCRYC